ncbi:MAG: LVIVD repeat [Bacteroidetes bacterium HLUCCA01]|nr:MAG: LVIVD repeat [Bacteroidetes bacterium HLUCCA01]
MKKNLRNKLLILPALLLAVLLSHCASTGNDGAVTLSTVDAPAWQLQPIQQVGLPSPDPRIGLQAGLFDAGEAIHNLRMVSTTPPPPDFIGSFNTDLAFKDNYIIQGNYNGFLVWDITNPAAPELVVDFLCPASQSDVSVYGDLLFVSGEGLEGRLDCGVQGVDTRISEERLRGIRIFDISDIRNPEYISNVQTCRGSHTHSVLVDPNDDENVYVYISGSAPVRPDEELPGCSTGLPDDNPETAMFRIEVIQVPLDNPAEARIVTSPRIFDGLEAPPVHGLAPDDIAALEAAREAGRLVANIRGMDRVISPRLEQRLLQIAAERNGNNEEPTEADRDYLVANLQDIVDTVFGSPDQEVRPGPNQCHDITLYPEIGMAGGACEGYGLLLDIRDPANPFRLDAVADSNFAYWHSATFNNDGTSVVFTDEWGGGTQAKCRANDPMEWGANALFSIENGQLKFESYFKIPVPQTVTENCVAHNGSLIPVPGRDIMVQGWYQGGITVFDFTDPANPIEMAYHDRGPVSDERLEVAGSWSVYWYNGLIINSEIARGLDIFELEASDFLTQNEIDAARSVEVNKFNAQGQFMFVWPASFAKARAYVDQLERNRELDINRLTMIRAQLAAAEGAQGRTRGGILSSLAAEVEGMQNVSGNPAKLAMLAEAIAAL